MGAFLDKPKTEKSTTSGQGNNIRYGVSAMQGWRMEMEDAHVCETKLSFGENYSFFGVFDGHAGPKVAQQCSKDLLASITDCYKKSQTTSEVERIKQAIVNGFLNLDKKLKKDIGDDRSGTTAIVSLITPDNIIFGNCGDSRGLLCKSGKVEFSTTDHKPYNDEEKLRIEKAGGTVMMQRVNGSLAVSRALGDFDYKRSTELRPSEQLVSPEPEVCVLERDTSNDQFLLLACDGIYDVMSNDAVVEFVSHHLNLTDKLENICSSLIDSCLNKNSRDNMSVILVTFPGAPTVSKEAIEKEEELQMEAKAAILEKIEELVELAMDPLDIEENHVLDHLDSVLDKRYDVYNKRSYISELLAERRKEKFGNDDDDDRGYNIGLSDASDAPSELTGGLLESRELLLGSSALPELEHTSEQQAQSPLSDPDTPPAQEGNNSPASKTIM